MTRRAARVARPRLRRLPRDLRGHDPDKRIVALANFNTDISEYREFSDTGFKPIDESNEACTLGVNYIIYGMTH